MDFDNQSLLQWIEATYYNKARELAEYLIISYNEYVHHTDESDPFINIKIGLTDSEIDVGTIINMAFKLLYDKGYETGITKSHRRRCDNDIDDEDIFDKKWIYKFDIVVFKRSD
jgi:hypothetical protein